MEIAAATGSGFARYAAVFLAGLRGSEAEAWPLFEAVITNSGTAGQGMGVQWSQWVSAILYNSLGRYEQALAEARQAAEQAPELFVSMWTLAELIEAASRTGQRRLAADALDRLAEATSANQTDWGRGIWHLGKVFSKLEISSRRHLQHALPDRASAGPVA